jgi:ribose transport system substrate-binding protein
MSKFLRWMARLSVSLTGFAILAGSLIIGGCSRSSAPAGPRFAFVTNGVASFWSIAAAGSRQAAKDLGVEVTVVMPDGLTDQTRKLEDLISRGIDGVAVSPINSANQIDILNKVAASTNLLTQDSDAPSSNRLAYVGMDNYEAGILCGQLARDALPDGGTMMLFVGRIDQENARYRQQGFIDGVLGRTPLASRRDPPGEALSSEDGKYQVLGTLTDQFDRAKAKANVEDTLTAHPDISAMVGLFAYNPPAILEALERAGKLGEIEVIGFDEDEVTLQAIQDGNAAGTIVQDPYKYGYESIRILAGLHAGDKSVLPEGGAINVPPRKIDKDNLQGFWTTLREQSATP